MRKLPPGVKRDRTNYQTSCVASGNVEAPEKSSNISKMAKIKIVLTLFFDLLLPLS
ncbi:hypothetical protein [Nostoc sp.]|uniref:hypothetical protein n=1 Tax=Nostoc sp. TaxID=1180 RepID=UPI002FFD0420